VSGVNSGARDVVALLTGLLLAVGLMVALMALIWFVTR